MKKGRSGKAFSKGASQGMSLFKDRNVTVHVYADGGTLQEAAQNIRGHMRMKGGMGRGRKPGPKSIAEALSK